MYKILLEKRRSYTLYLKVVADLERIYRENDDFTPRNWHFSTKSKKVHMIVSRFYAHLNLRYVLAPIPHSMSFYVKNVHMKRCSKIHDVSHKSSSPMPHSMSNCKKFLVPWGRRGHLRTRVRDDDIDWGMGERMKKILSPTARSKNEIVDWKSLKSTFFFHFWYLLEFPMGQIWNVISLMKIVFSFKYAPAPRKKNATFKKAWCELMRKPSHPLRKSTIFQWNQYEMKSMHVNISNFFLIYTTCLQRLFYMFLKLFIYQKKLTLFLKKYLQRQWKCSCITSPHAFHFSTPGPHPMLSKKLSIFAGGTKVSVVSSCRQHCLGSGGWRILDEKNNISYYIKKKLRFFMRSGCVVKGKTSFFLKI